MRDWKAGKRAKPLSISQKVAGLLFDMGGVVFEIDFDRALQAWSSWTNLSLEEIRLRFKMDAAYEQHEKGEIGASEYFSHLRSLLEIEANDAEIALGWNAIYLEEITETVNCILAVGDQLPCYAFTNSNPTHQAFWMDAYPRAVNSFRRIFVSSEIGLRKPDRKAFEFISDTTGISLDGILFFDDSEANIDGARAAGMPAVLVKTPVDVNYALAGIGVL
jgi:putative hydrolase of the HAD superfamily